MADPQPPTTLSTLTTRLLLILGDPEANRFTAEITQEGFRLALSEYSYAAPNIYGKIFTVVQAGREQALPVAGEDEDAVIFPGLISITRVLYPYTGETAFELDPLQRYYFYFTDGCPVLYIGGQRVPSVGEQIHIDYAAAHQIDGLAEASICTVPTHDFELILQGAAGHAARLRTSIYNESFSAHPELKAFALDNLAQFRATLRQLRRQANHQALPAAGFKVDGWDGK